MSENYKFTQNKVCEYFPCHKGVPEEEFNCLFCYCPLYALGDKCGGDFVYTAGIKDCSNCSKPHEKGSYEFVMSKINLIIELGSK
jgi:Zn-finger protein